MLKEIPFVTHNRNVGIFYNYFTKCSSLDYLVTFPPFFRVILIPLPSFKRLMLDMCFKESVRIGSEVSEWFLAREGLIQGCLMLPWLFNLYIDGVVREVNA